MQKVTGKARQQPALPQADPEQTDSFQRPGCRCPGRAHGQGNRKGGETYRQRRERLNQ